MGKRAAGGRVSAGSRRGRRCAPQPSLSRSSAAPGVENGRSSRRCSARAPPHVGRILQLAAVQAAKQGVHDARDEAAGARGRAAGVRKVGVALDRGKAAGDGGGWRARGRRRAGGRAGGRGQQRAQRGTRRPRGVDIISVCGLRSAGARGAQRRCSQAARNQSAKRTPCCWLPLVKRQARALPSPQPSARGRGRPPGPASGSGRSRFWPHQSCPK